MLIATAAAMLSVVFTPHAAAQPAPPPTGGGVGIRLVDAPVSNRDDPRASVYIVDHLAPGTTIDRRLEISNTTGEAATVGLYAAAAEIRDGSFVGSPDRTANELSTWVSLNPNESNLVDGERAQSTITIAVPADAAPGEQYGVVWAEVRSAPSSDGVTQVSRVGIRIYLSVGPGNAPAADFAIDSVTPGRTEAGEPIVEATVRNTGGRAIDMSGSLSLADGPGALNAGPFPAVLGSTLAPGDEGPVTITLDQQLPAGPWNATITMKSGLIERSAEATVTFPDSGTSDPVGTSRARTWQIAAAALVVIVLAAAAIFIVRRRRTVR